MVEQSVTFGFSEKANEPELAGDPCVETPRNVRSPDVDKLKLRGVQERNAGLGSGPGGSIARSFLSGQGSFIIDALPSSRAHRGGLRSVYAGPELKRPPVPSSDSNKHASLAEGPEPQGMFLGLLLNDMQPPSREELSSLCEHRWIFHGALDFAKQGRSLCFFVHCLLDLQRNVQLEEEGDALEPSLASACKAFVNAQCREGRMGNMYQLLTHFVSNSVIFYEWDHFLRTAFEDDRAGKESFIVPYLEQVWCRFQRLSSMLEAIFDVLNTKFTWRHRLPKIEDLIRDHVKKRCFSSEAILRNELFSQTGCRNETIKQVKYTFNIH